jgi:hypothetical protein
MESLSLVLVLLVSWVSVIKGGLLLAVLGSG